jgi:hypothetical protein
MTKTDPDKNKKYWILHPHWYTEANERNGHILILGLFDIKLHTYAHNSPQVETKDQGTPLRRCGK